MAAPHDEQLDDSPPKLPEDTLKLLQEFLAEQSVSRQSGLTLSNQDGNFGSVKVSEDWVRRAIASTFSFPVCRSTYVVCIKLHSSIYAFLAIKSILV